MLAGNGVWLTNNVELIAQDWLGKGEPVTGAYQSKQENTGITMRSNNQHHQWADADLLCFRDKLPAHRSSKINQEVQ